MTKLWLRCTLDWAQSNGSEPFRVERIMKRFAIFLAASILPAVSFAGNWGERWGTMVWGAEVSRLPVAAASLPVPVDDPWALALGAVVLVVIAIKRLGSRNWFDLAPIRPWDWGRGVQHRRGWAGRGRKIVSAVVFGLVVGSKWSFRWTTRAGLAGGRPAEREGLFRALTGPGRALGGLKRGLVPPTRRDALRFRPTSPRWRCTRFRRARLRRRDLWRGSPRASSRLHSGADHLERFGLPA